MLPKTFDPKAVEPRLYQRWEASGAFAPKDDPGAEPYCIVIPPPNVTGSLHIGHALNNTLQDILTRFERMRGKAALWLPGTDHAGIATQMVVERQLAASGANITRREMGREAFVERVWAWKAESGGKIEEQLRRLGASCDWSRERFTLDPGLSAAVRRVFVQLYKEGLIYRDKRLVNWDPQFQTAISDLEVEQREVDGQYWHFAYPLADGPVDGVGEIVVATTRPETMLGDTAVAVHPDDERYRGMVGKMLAHPITGRKISIVADEYADPEKGSGAVKITPAHDFNDFQVGKRHDLPLINILDAHAHLNDQVPAAYAGMDRFVARKAIVEEMQALDLMRGIEKTRHVVPHGDRSGVVIEPYLTDQWYVDAEVLAQPAIKAVEDGRTVFEPKHWEKTYFEWMRNIEPWCVSRQLWWGHRIPAWYGPEGEVFVEESEEAARAAARARYGEDRPLRQDEDVLDTWFSSALWPFSTLGWPEEAEDLRRFYPTTDLVTGFDIIFFWVARMMMMGLHFMGEVPFRRVVINGLVRDEKGQKMSKSKGNVIDPLEVVDELGADPLRFTMAILSGTRDIKLSRQRIEGYRNFGTKLWNAARFAQMNGCVVQPGFDPGSAELTLNRWIRGETVKTSVEVTRALEAAHFDEAASSLYRFVWNVFCDWHLELAKPVLNGADEAAKAETRAMTAWVLDQALKLLHPITPFVTEELWDKLGEEAGGRDSLLIAAPWPDLPESWVDEEAEAEIGWLIELVSQVRSIRSEMNVPPSARPPLTVSAAGPATLERLERYRDLLLTLARLSSADPAEAPPKGGAPFVVGEATFALGIADFIDLAAERARLAKEIGTLGGDIDRAAKKLGNPDYVARAPEHVVAETQEKLAEAQAALEKLDAARKRLEAAASPPRIRSAPVAKPTQRLRQPDGASFRGQIVPIDFEAYLRALSSTRLDEKTEHTDRGALERLLTQAAEAADPLLHVQHEPRRDEGGAGSPDYLVKRVARIVGYVEDKPVDENLSKVLKSPQIKKYRSLSDNLLITDYLEFVWVKDGEMQRARLAHSEDVWPRRLAPTSENTERVSKILRGFFSSAPQAIGRGKVLAVELAKRAALLRDFLTEELVRQSKENDKGRLHALFDAFRVQVFHELAIKDFADAFAQMLAYGLFLARLNAADDQVRLDNVRRFIPASFGLIRELVRFLEEMEEPEYRPGKWIVDEILSIVNGIELADIHNDLSFRARKAISRKVRAGDEEEHRLFERDPFIYFYEDFLKAYDPGMRKGRGVYYTPPPVVNFIVRAVDDVLKGPFGMRDGLADHRKVTVLDFACGTGTFLLEIFERIFDTIGGPEAGRADAIVREHLLKNLYGFEYLIAPYTIAHLKLSQWLKDKDHPFHDDERLQVLLTNTLEPVEPQYDSYFPAISREVEAAQKVKERRILVIVGNPPYFGESKNKGEWITKRINGYEDDRGQFVLGYKHTVERRPDVSSADGLGPEEIIPLGERNSKWLHDDYVKFIRFAQLKMDAVDEGVVGIITNHSWLENPTFRGMRQSLMRSFHQIYVLDLHGNTKKKERAPDGSKDENVFDIEQGVAISLFVKKRGLERGVWRGDLWGKRLEKYRITADESLVALADTAVQPKAPYYRYELEDEVARGQYDRGAPVPLIFKEGGTGIITKRDAFTIYYSEDDVWTAISRFTTLEPERARREFHLPADVRDWKVADAQADILQDGPDRRKIRRIRYRPFDDRFTYYTGRARGFLGWPVERIARHFEQPNVGLITSRLTKGEDFRHVQATELMNEVIVMSSITSNNGFTYPLWLYDDDSKTENVRPEFRAFLDARYEHHYTPEEIFGYVYAVLHAPTYRRRYAEFLRIDFPRIQFPEAQSEFNALSALGWELVQAHLLKAVPRSAEPLGDYFGKGDHVVEAVRYSPEEQIVWINKTQGLANVTQAVWDFQIGGYQVLDKYLKTRRARALDLDEQTHVGEVAEVLAFTIIQMGRIDAAYVTAFPDGG